MSIEPVAAPATEVEPVPCTRCGTFVAPDDLAIRREGLCKACLLKCNKPWSPGLIGGLSFVFGFGGAGVLHALNARRLGKAESVALPIVFWVGAFAAMCGLFAVAGDLARPAGLAINVATALFFARAHRERFDRYRELGGEAGSTWAAVGTAIGTTVAVFVPVVGLFIGMEMMRFDRAYQAMERGELDEAYPTFERMCEDEDPAACTNAGVIEEQRGDLAGARRFYERACRGEDPTGCSNLDSLR